MKTTLLLASVMALAVVPAIAAGQDPRGQASLLAGPSRYDLTGTGTAVAFNLGVAVPLSRVLLLTPGLGYINYRTTFGSRSNWFLPEIGVQLQSHLHNVRPYVGGGIGAGNQSKSTKWVATLHAAAGARVHLSGAWGAQVEFRYRSIDPFGSHTADAGIGITHASF